MKFKFRPSHLICAILMAVSACFVINLILPGILPDWLSLAGAGGVAMAACPITFDVLRMKTEQLGPTLHARASYMENWLNLVPREPWAVGTGLTQSSFTIGRSEPASDEETWVPIQTSVGGPFGAGTCGDTFNQTYVGFKEVTFNPEGFALVGPLICQDDLTIMWKSGDFWERYFQALEKRNTKSIVNRLGNIYMNYSTKVIPLAGGTIQYVDGNFATQPPASTVDWVTGSPSTPGCGLTQDFLDTDATMLIQLGAMVPDSNGWIVLGEDGPIFPLLIGMEASQQLLLNNSELRQDYRAAYQAQLGELNPVIKRVGASRVIKNFRHMVTPFPARWNVTNGVWTRIPVWKMSTASKDATKGQVSIINPDWQNPAVANVEAAVVLNPSVMTEMPLVPVNTAPGMKWEAQNYMGEWKFVTGNDALLGFPGCSGIQDPLHTQGRHFARYRHAAKPIFPEYGRVYPFLRCPTRFDCLTCS